MKKANDFVLNTNSEVKAIINWKLVCLPINDGGLGLDNLMNYTTAHSCKLIGYFHRITKPLAQIGMR